MKNIKDTLYTLSKEAGKLLSLDYERHVCLYSSIDIEHVEKLPPEERTTFILKLNGMIVICR
ncbi:hypothetical protein NGK36_22490 [Hafnia alvei]|uniref:hypothetical protein n=1 Tax=Hafnia alvei TaxID=569 RepID=UPI002DBF3F2B|nr:hypothetical protein [Hafnia alvei]MEB7892019.1 hypothetical protein [Hafnia alvei]